MLVFPRIAAAPAASRRPVRTGTTLGGTLYIPAATLTMTAANSVTIASQIVADQFVLKWRQHADDDVHTRIDHRNARAVARGVTSVPTRVGGSSASRW